MDFEGAFLDSEGALLHSLPKSGGHGPSDPPVPTSLVPAYETGPQCSILGLFLFLVLGNL